MKIGDFTTVEPGTALFMKEGQYGIVTLYVDENFARDRLTRVDKLFKVTVATVEEIT